MRALKTLLLGVCVASCSSSGTATDDVIVIAEVTALDAIQPNGCGGITPLSLDGKVVVPGGSCGECGGIVTCDGPDAAQCVGATVANACGGCEPLAGAPGTTCGQCGGQWKCNEDGAVECSDTRQRNVCGGCDDLGGASPGVKCEQDGLPGVTRCVTLNAVQCIPLAANGCGGTEDLGAVPGTFCGACDRGVLVCADADTLLCEGEQTGVNACGGCGALAGQPGDPCPGCGGEWTCSADANSVECSAEPNNACGGCAPLEATPGAPCDGGVWACKGIDSLACVPAGGNLCGGTAVLAADPGAHCGPCGDGLVVCATADWTVCSGASGLNACDSCGALPGAPGDACAPNGTWSCSNGKLVCHYAANANPCGGSTELGQAPGTPCGVCDAGTLVCNGFDAVVCSGVVAADFLAWPDADGDEYGDGEAEPVEQCELADGFVRNGDDCDDTSELGAAIHPGAIEQCDGIDNDCDDVIDPGSAVGAAVYHRDQDGDGIGAEALVIAACVAPAGYVQPSAQFDCNDNDATVFPGATGESCSDPKDYNCDGVTSFVDADKDGFAACDDCNDDDPAVHPGAVELCNGKDDNCVGGIDEPSAADVTTWYRDADEDTYGDPTDVVAACAAPVGYVDNPDDCNDALPTIHPTATESCDGVDNNCDGNIDLDTPIADKPTWHLDTDGDGFGSAFDTTTACVKPAGYVPASSAWVEDATPRFDCDPTNPAIHPHLSVAPVLEQCDFIDNDCDGHVDMGPWSDAGWPEWPTTASPGFLWAADRDDDGYGSSSELVEGCWPALEAATPSHGALGFLFIPAVSGGEPTDCNDNNASVYPGAVEVPGDGVDQSCDGVELCFFDGDGDGAVGDFTLTVPTLGPDCLSDGDPATAAADAPWDCDDTTEAIRPGATEVIGDEIDQNCDGVEFCFLDADGDGFRRAVDDGQFVFSEDRFCDNRALGEAAASQPAVDCDDTNPNRHPAANDVATDWSDTDCDGLDGSAWRSRFAAPDDFGGSFDADCGPQTKPCAIPQMAVDAAAVCPATFPDFIAECQSWCYQRDDAAVVDQGCFDRCEARGTQGGVCDVMMTHGTYEMPDTLVIPPGMRILGGLDTVSDWGSGRSTLVLAADSSAATTVAIPSVTGDVRLGNIDVIGPDLDTLEAHTGRAPDSVAIHVGHVGAEQVRIINSDITAGRGATAMAPVPPLVGSGCPAGCPAQTAGGRANYDLLMPAPDAPRGGHSALGRGGDGGGNSIALLVGGARVGLQTVAITLGQGGNGADGTLPAWAGGTSYLSPYCGSGCGNSPYTGGGGAGGAAVGIAVARGGSIPAGHTSVTIEGGSPGTGGSGACAFGKCADDGSSGLIFPYFSSSPLATEHYGQAVRAQELIVGVAGQNQFLDARTTCHSVGATLGSNQWPDSPSFLSLGLESNDWWVDYLQYPEQTPQTEGAPWETPIQWNGVTAAEDTDCWNQVGDVLEATLCSYQRQFIIEAPAVFCQNESQCTFGQTCVVVTSGQPAPPGAVSDTCPADATCVCTLPFPGDTAGLSLSYDKTSLYQLSLQAVSWDEANQLANQVPGHLISFDNTAEWAEASTWDLAPFWTGLSDQWNEGNPRWTTGLPLSPEVSSQPNVHTTNSNAGLVACGLLRGAFGLTGATATITQVTEWATENAPGEWSNACFSFGARTLCRTPTNYCGYGRQGGGCGQCTPGFEDVGGVCVRTCAESPCHYGACSDCIMRGDCATNPVLECACPTGREGEFCERCANGLQDWDRNGACYGGCPEGCGDANACGSNGETYNCLNGCPENQQDNDLDGVCACKEGFDPATGCTSCRSGYSGSDCRLTPLAAIEFPFNQLSALDVIPNQGGLGGVGILNGFGHMPLPDSFHAARWTTDAALGEGALRFAGGQFVDFEVDENNFFHPFTISVWVKRDDVATEQVLVSASTNVGGSIDLLGLRADGRVFAHAHDAPNCCPGCCEETVEQPPGSPGLQPGVWHHVAYKNKSGEPAQLFIDGVVVAEGDLDAVDTPWIRIGADWSSQRHFHGVLDHVESHGNDDIQALYEAGLAAMGN